MPVLTSGRYGRSCHIVEAYAAGLEHVRRLAGDSTCHGRTRPSWTCILARSSGLAGICSIETPRKSAIACRSAISQDSLARTAIRKSKKISCRSIPLSSSRAAECVVISTCRPEVRCIRAMSAVARAGVERDAHAAKLSGVQRPDVAHPAAYRYGVVEPHCSYVADEPQRIQDVRLAGMRSGRRRTSVRAASERFPGGSCATLSSRGAICSSGGSQCARPRSVMRQARRAAP